MEWWVTIAKDGGGWVVSVGMAALFIRSLMRGDLVLSREHTRLVEQVDKITAQAEALTQEQRDAARVEREDFLARLSAKEAERKSVIARLEASEAEIRKLRGGT